MTQREQDKVTVWLFAFGFIFGGVIGFLAGVVITLIFKS